nr:MAG TPA: hypothetical protein [Caudoviricetes sp.]DAS91537.1 MAG TPA: hypothetical protein [Caudoviricetes sp.]
MKFSFLDFYFPIVYSKALSFAFKFFYFYKPIEK